MSCDLGIACHMSSHLETGVLQRDSRVWLHPKRRLACPLGRLPMKPNGARRRRRIDVPRRGTLLRSGQYGNCAKRHSVSSSEAKPWALYLTRMRVNAQEEKRKHGITCNTSSPLGDGSPAEGLPSLAPSKEAPSLPTRAPSYEAKRCAPKAQDRCASKRHPSTQRSV